jgi:hypothetical protein
VRERGTDLMAIIRTNQKELSFLLDKSITDVPIYEHYLS